MSLDMETMLNASEIINSVLLLRAYIDQELQFPTIHWKSLLGDQVDDIKITDKLYNNDKNIINIIHSLVGAVDRSRKQQQLANIIIKRKDNEIHNLSSKVSSLEAKLEELQDKLSESKHIQQSQLQHTIAELNRENSARTREVNQLKVREANVKTKYNVEIKKRDLQISELKNRLLDKRSLNSSSLQKYVNQPPDLNANIIYNNNPIIDNPMMTSSAGEEVPTSQDLVRDEYENIISELTPIIESLVTENFKYSLFVNMASEYLQVTNGQITNKREITNPSESIDLGRFNTIEPEEVKQYFKTLQPFEKVTKPLLNNIYKLYHVLRSLTSQNHEGERARLKQLETELETVKQNWKDALGLAENWKNLRDQAKGE